MKKTFCLFALLALVMFTSCNDDEPINKQTINSTFNCRAVDLEEGTVVFSQSTAKIEINYNEMTIQFNTTYKDLDGISQTLNTPVMKLKAVSSGTIYSMVTTYDNYNVINGYIDLATGMIWYDLSQYIQDGYFDASPKTVYMTTQLLYAYATTVVTNEAGASFEHQRSAYLFALDSKGETCTMQISNFIPDTNGAIQATTVEYEGLNVTPTHLGYVITADEVESSYSGFYSIKDVHFTLDAECNVISGTYKVNGHDFTVSGNLFPNAQ